MRTYASSQVKRKSFHRKSELQIYETVGHKDQRLGEILYILVFYNISFSWLLPLDSFQFSFFFVPCLLGDSENEELVIRLLLAQHAHMVNKHGLRIIALQFPKENLRITVHAFCDFCGT